MTALVLPTWFFDLYLRRGPIGQVLRLMEFRVTRKRPIIAFSHSRCRSHSRILGGFGEIHRDWMTVCHWNYIGISVNALHTSGTQAVFYGWIPLVKLMKFEIFEEYSRRWYIVLIDDTLSYLWIWFNAYLGFLIKFPPTKNLNQKSHRTRLIYRILLINWH